MEKEFKVGDRAGVIGEVISEQGNMVKLRFNGCYDVWKLKKLVKRIKPKKKPDRKVELKMWRSLLDGRAVLRGPNVNLEDFGYERVPSLDVWEEEK